MMNGLKRNTARLFGHGGKLFVMAMDHAQTGAVEGLSNVAERMRICADSELDGYLVNVGQADFMAEGTLVNKKLLLRTSFGGTKLSGGFAGMHRNHVSPETALALGADAAVMMMVLGENDAAGIQQAAADIDGYHRLGIPVVVEILAMDFAKTATYEIQCNGARVAAELGADVVKAFYTDHFAEVIKNCPVPVILAGGPKDREITELARAALDCGVQGFAFGRNLFMAEDCQQRIEALSRILRG